jgi:RNA polymerase sigma-70 factor (ECF subfamily)
MSCYISSNANRLYTALESDYGQVPAITAANRIAAVKLTAKQNLVKAQRRERMREVLERDTPGPSGPKAPDVDLANALQQLPLKQRTCVLLFYYEDRPIAEIVDILGISEGAVKVHLHRARERLATLPGEEVAEGAH